MGSRPTASRKGSTPVLIRDPAREVATWRLLAWSAVFRYRLRGSSGRCVDVSLTLLVEPHVHRMLRCNVWHVRGRRRNLVVDTGLGITSLRAAAEDLFGDDVLAVATHAHVDHVGGLHEFDQRAIHVAEAVAVAHGGPPLDLDVEHADPARVEQLATWGYDVRGGLLTALPRDDLDVGNVPRHPAPCTQLLHEGDVIDLGDRAFEVLHLPGHSPGSIGLWDEHNARAVLRRCGLRRTIARRDRGSRHRRLHRHDDASARPARGGRPRWARPVDGSTALHRDHRHVPRAPVPPYV